MTIDTWPPDGSSPIFVRGYHGRTYEAMIAAFHDDAVLLLQQGYEPACQHYVEGKWGFGLGVLATLTIPLIVGALVWIQILASRPLGTLTVTYVHRAG
ncbi:MAG: hypothetical protein ABSC46_08635 [Candidatus Limnocylindrales bacterium]